MCGRAGRDCELCNGPAPLRLNMFYIPEGDSNCDGNQLDALGDCGFQCRPTPTLPSATDVDPCVGELDDCGVCNGSGAIYDCGCVDIPEGDCDCDGNQLDALGDCGGPCEADADMDGICDDVDPCVGSLTTAASAMDQARFTTADVLTSQKATATATATSLTPLASADELRRRRHGQASATTLTHVLASLTTVAYATRSGAIYDWGVDIPEAVTTTEPADVLGE